MTYTHLLKARLSPQNGCYAEDGIILSVLPRKAPLKEVSHYFVAAHDLATKSKYGWVEEVSPFTLEEFLHSHHHSSTDPVLVEHVKRMLDAAQKFPIDTPMTADYTARGIPPRIEFWVHRVFFRHVIETS